LGLIDLHGILLDPAVFGIDLLGFFLGDPTDLTCIVKEDGS
jgi:hypothetical protein